jgi:hypothetical protein
MYSTLQLLTPPKGFEEVWFPIREQLRFSNDERNCLSEAMAVLIFTDIHDRWHLQTTCNLAAGIANQVGTDSPPVVLVPHMTSANSSDANSPDLLEQQIDRHSHALNAHIDAVILGEPEGIKLAAEVSSIVIQQMRQAERLNRRLNSIREHCQNTQHLEEDNHDAVWEYLRVKLHSGIPCIDDDIGPGQPDTLNDLIVGGKLGEGSYGMVCRLVDPSNLHSSSGQVLKMILKKPLTTFHGIASLKREINVMNVLNLEEHHHPNVMRLYDVYHTETHILFRMEDGGKLDLYKRLSLREQRTPPLPLGIQKATSILKECMAGLTHLHIQANVVHRDLKPENIIVAEKAENLTIKLADFDVAFAGKPGVTHCAGKVGTFPFFAPEVIRASTYDPFAADIWSLGVVFFEVICRLNVLKKGVGLYLVKKVDKKVEETLMMEKIQGYFSIPNNAKVLSQKYIHPDLNILLDDAQTLLDGMLTVAVESRWTAIHIREASNDLFVICPGSNSP